MRLPPWICISLHDPLISDPSAWIFFLIFYLCIVGREGGGREKRLPSCYSVNKLDVFFCLHKCLLLEVSYHVINATCLNKQRFIYCAERTFCAPCLICSIIADWFLLYLLLTCQQYSKARLGPCQKNLLLYAQPFSALLTQYCFPSQLLLQ